uniref:Carboxypeptidase Q n=1 Tax=Parascaris univalens TaxID=6257 RepID=A0A915CGR7_PARUN
MLLCHSIFLFLIFFFSVKANGDIQKFEKSSHQLLDYIIKGNGSVIAYEWLSNLVDEFGPRHLGSENLDKAIEYVVHGLINDGFDNVHTEEVPDLPKWVRGDDVVEMIEPRVQRLKALAIDGCPPADLTAEAVVLTDFQELKDHNVSGKIVVFAQKWIGYSKTLKYRRAAYTVQELGAVGVLVKSIAPNSFATPHTGSGARGSRIPALTITSEEADMLKRISNRGKKITIHLSIKSHPDGTVSSRNVLFEIRGSERPSEVVLLSAHIDSWDVGQGALDDGGGCAAMWNALFALKQLADSNPVFVPKRTIRVAFWTAEEQGLIGARYYYESHKNDSHERFVFASETDQGAFKPLNWFSSLEFAGTKAQKKRLNGIVEIINKYGIPLSILINDKQGDVQPWADEGIPTVNYLPDRGREHYFLYHHTDADYINVFEDGDLEYTAAIFAVVAHIVANTEDVL